MDIRVILSDRSEDVVAAWRDRFEKRPEVEIREGDVFETGADAVVVAGNAFGFLDRGVELQACERYGWDVQDALRDIARSRFAGELLVGQACIVELPPPHGHLVYTCIARTPRPLEGTVNAYLAARGAFLALRAPDAPPIASVAFTGLGTGELGLHPQVSARQLRYAYDIFRGHRGFGDKNLTQLSRRERKLGAIPKWALRIDAPGTESESAPETDTGT